MEPTEAGLWSYRRLGKYHPTTFEPKKKKIKRLKETKRPNNLLAELKVGI